MAFSTRLNKKRNQSEKEKSEKLRGRVRCSLSYYLSIDDDLDGIPSVHLFLESHIHLIGLLCYKEGTVGNGGLGFRLATGY